MTTSANGQDIYVMWASHGNVDVTSSHDAGFTFSTPVQITNESGIYYYPNGGTVLPNGTAEIVASEYPEKGNNTKITGPINIVAFRSTNLGSSWQRTVVDTLNTGATFATSSLPPRSPRTLPGRWCSCTAGRPASARTARSTFAARPIPVPPGARELR